MKELRRKELIERENVGIENVLLASHEMKDNTAVLYRSCQYAISVVLLRINQPFIGY